MRRLLRGTHPNRDDIAIVLATGFVLNLGLLTFGVLWNALHSTEPGLSENATQLLLAAFTGLVGLLGGYIGARREPTAEPAPPTVEAPATEGPIDTE